jgi:hypothetical protein
MVDPDLATKFVVLTRPAEVAAADALDAAFVADVEAAEALDAAFVAEVLAADCDVLAAVAEVAALPW